MPPRSPTGPEVNRAAAERSAPTSVEAEQASSALGRASSHEDRRRSFKKLIARLEATRRWRTRTTIRSDQVAEDRHRRGTRRNARMLIEYVEGWLGGRRQGIDSLEASRASTPR